MRLLTFATQLAHQTGELLLDQFKLSGITADLKTDLTIITEADLAADRLIHKSIQEAFPQDGILSEEQGTIYPSDKPAVWVIDPLDGTTNFSLGLHYWGVSIARLVDGLPVLATLYFPLLNELYTAKHRSGAFLNNESLHTKPSDKNRPISFFSCCSRTHRQYEIRVPFKTRILGSASYTLCTVARGSAVLAFEATPKVWDFAASWLIVREAGGVIHTLDDSSPFPLVPGRDYSKKSYPTLAAATPELAIQGQQQITPKKNET